jgi:hypothetical protein
VRPVPSYLIELYLANADSLERASEDARRVERASVSAGGGARYLRTFLVPEDETCFHLFEAPSRDAVVEAATRAGLADARVTETLQNGETTTPARRVP